MKKIYTFLLALAFFVSILPQNSFSQEKKNELKKDLKTIKATFQNNVVNQNNKMTTSAFLKNPENIKIPETNMNSPLATRTASVTGNWSNTVTWGGNPVPTSSDNVIINSGITVTVDISNAQCASLTMNRPSNGNTNTLNVNAGTLSCSSLVMNGTSATRYNIINITTGTFNISGNITVAYQSSQINLTGAGTLNIGGTLNGSPTIPTVSGCTVNYTGSSAQIIYPISYQGNLGLSGAGTKTISNLYAQNIVSVYGNFINSSSLVLSAGTSTNYTWLVMGGNATNNPGATINSTASYTRFDFNSADAQTFTNNGIMTSPVASFDVENTNASGLTLSGSNGIIVTRANLFFGRVTNSNKITFGTGGTSYAVIQRGEKTSALPVGSFDIPPTFNIGSGGLYLIYDYASADYTIDKEVPASGSVFYMIFYPLSARTITLAKTVTISGTGSALEFATGNVSKFALGANNLTINPSATITGAGASSYVKTNGTGQLKRTVNNNNSYVLFPVGLSAYNPLNIKLTTTSTTNIFGVKISDAISNPGYVPTKTVSRQWDITRATSDIDSATIQFQFNAGEGLSDYGTAEIGHWNSSFSFYDAISAGITGSGPYVITNIQPITTFSPFIVGNAGSMPVELSSFTANVISRDVKLNWTTANETNNEGFEIQKSEVRNQKSTEWVKIGYITGNGTKTTPTNYSFDDRKLNTGKYKYRLKQIDYNGNFEYFNLTGEIEIDVPNKFDISQNYPNPFNPTTKIDFDLPYDSKVSMKLYDISGREVMTLMNETKAAGYYTVQMNGNNLSSGMYFYRIIAEGNGQNFVSVKKLVLIK